MRSTRIPMASLAATALLAGFSPAQSIVLTIDGDSAADQLGFAVGDAGDVDQDGYADVIAGASRDDNNGLNSGSARVVSGKDGTILHQFDGDSANDQLGFAVDGVGDVNGDGRADVAAGAVFDDDNGTDCGMVRVYSGADGSTLFTFYGTTVNDNLGGDVAGAGDVNNDGFNDIVSGMDRHDMNGSDSGSARVFSGLDGAILYTFGGDSPNDNFGFAVDGAGDVNNDGNADVVVGTWADDNTGVDAGIVRVHSGVDGAILHSFDGDATNDSLGWSVAGAGDVNGDGHADVIGGAPGDDNTFTGAGMVRVYSGFDGAVLHQFDGDATGDQLGYAVGGDFDANGDGTPDVIGGAWFDDNTGLNAGSARVWSGATGSVLMTIDGSAGDRLGRSVAGGGDVDQDGFDDALAGANLADPNGASSGQVVVASGCDSGVVTYGVGCAGSGGFVPEVGLVGCPNSGGEVTLFVEEGLGGSTAFLFFGAGMGSAPMGGGCNLLVSPLSPVVGVLPLSAGGPGDGAISIPAVMPALAFPVTFTMQGVVADGGVPIGFSNSAGVEVSVLH